MQVTTLPYVTQTKLNCNPNASLEFLSRYAQDTLNPAFETSIQRFIAAWAQLHGQQIECDDQLRSPGTAFVVQDAQGHTCPMQTQRCTDTLEVLARNWQKYQTFSDQALLLAMRNFEITSFAEFDFGEPLPFTTLALAAD
jgi:hypothetical protein